jgi:hypothetical protein
VVVMELVELKAAGGGKGMAVAAQMWRCNGARSTLIGEEVKGQVRGMPFCVRLLVTAGVYLGDGCLLTGCRLTVFHNAPLLSLSACASRIHISVCRPFSLSLARARSLSRVRGCLSASQPGVCLLCVLGDETHALTSLRPCSPAARPMIVNLKTSAKAPSYMHTVLFAGVEEASDCRHCQRLVL